MTIKYDRSIADISTYFSNQGFYYTEEQIYNFYVSLITKPFVILSGISGSGKSKIIDLFAEYMGKSYNNTDNYELIAVKPNWTDSRGIFGYHNLLNDIYQITPTLKLFLRALANPTKPYFLVLDEMNLAKVEYYFSDFLSLIESRRLSMVEVESEDFDTVRISLGGNITLSQAIILSAIQMNSDDFKSVSDYRDTPIAQWWLQNYSTGNHPTAQFRTELNQGRGRGSTGPLKPDGTRLAGRAFLAEQQGNSYKLKKEAEMDATTLTEFKKLKSALIIEKSVIKQEQISLHDFPHPLKTFENQDIYSDFLFKDGEYYVPSKIDIPLNVFVIGTVNVDETTYMFSPKVLDRSNVIEFNDIDLFNAYGYGSSTNTGNQIPINKSQDSFDMKISIATSDSTKLLKDTYPDEFEIIISAFEYLQPSNRQFGYRVFNEISSYILNYCGTKASSDEIIDAIDLQMLQKIMPKINGTDDEIMELITNLLNLATDNNLFRSKRKLERMANNLNITGYTTFIE